jgi:hypothetical protein
LQVAILTLAPSRQRIPNQGVYCVSHGCSEGFVQGCAHHPVVGSGHILFVGFHLPAFLVGVADSGYLYMVDANYSDAF